CRRIALTLCENGARRSDGWDQISAEAVTEAAGSALPFASTPAITSDPIPETPNDCPKSGMVTMPFVASEDGGRVKWKELTPPPACGTQLTMMFCNESRELANVTAVV